MKKRYIFDLDGTLLNGDYRDIRSFFIDKYGEKILPFLDSMGEYLSCYEREVSKYDYDTLSRFLTWKTDLSIDITTVREWDLLSSEMVSEKEKYALETLEYLKKQGKSLAILSNWFGDTQKERLRRADLLKYFDNIYGGDIATKPHREAYFNAVASYDPADCVFIGDNVFTDYVGPRSCSIDSILYDKEDRYHDSLVKIKRLNELKKNK